VLVVIVLLCLALVAAGVFALLGLRQHSTASTPSARTATSAPASTTATPAKLAIAGARDFDPQGDPPEENPGEVKYAYDGDPTTKWQTNRYLGSPKLGNLKRGVGLVVDLGSVHSVSSVAVSLSGAGTDLQIRVPKGDPSTVTKPPMGSDSDWHSVGKADKATKTTTIDLATPVQTRYLLVYLTSLPAEGGGYRGGVYEIDVYE
jgi:putative peptidoglycan lipid II flippase